MRQILLLLACGSLAAAAPSAAAEAGGKKGAGEVAMAPADLQWTGVPGRGPGFMVARVWGVQDGAQGRFTKIPANTKLPLHKHTANVTVVVVSGTYVYGREGAPEKQYPVGSFVLTPAGTPHIAGCSDACVYYEEIDGKPDFIQVSAGK